MGDDEEWLRALPPGWHEKVSGDDAEIFAEVIGTDDQIVSASDFAAAAPTRRIETALPNGNGDLGDLGYAREMGSYFEDLIGSLLQTSAKAHAQEAEKQERWLLRAASEQLMCDALDLIGFMENLVEPAHRGELFDMTADLIENALRIARSDPGASERLLLPIAAGDSPRRRGLGVQLQIRAALRELYTEGDPVETLGLSQKDVSRAICDKLEVKEGTFSPKTLSRARDFVWRGK